MDAAPEEGIPSRVTPLRFVPAPPIVSCVPAFAGTCIQRAPALPWAVIALIFVIPGLALSIWSIVHMKKVGDGNPFDAYNHEVAPRTRNLMTDGPYRFSRNPMLLGVYLYDIGILLWLQSWWPLLVFAAEVFLLTLQVRSEEKRLEADFGDEYRAYKQSVRRYL